MMRLAGLLASAALVLGVAAAAAGEPAFRESAVDMEFVFVPGGRFEMGDTFGDGRANERPAHPVAVADLYLGRFEVTVAQYRRFAERSGYRTAAEQRGWVLDIDPGMNAWVRVPGLSWRNPGYPASDDDPVGWVTWDDAAAFVRWLAEETGRPYRLPTEAEWEYAARGGGRPGRWSGAAEGDDADRFAWHAGNSGGHARPVGGRAPNALGLYDMSGNVWEWCADWDAPYRGGDLLHDPQGPPEGSYKVLRGGSWRVAALLARVTYRSAYKPDYAHASIGFRVALGAPPRRAGGPGPHWAQEVSPAASWVRRAAFGSFAKSRTAP